MDDQKRGRARAGDCARTPPLSAGAASRGDGLAVGPNKNRLIQVRRTGSRKLFDKKRKEVWLEWFAATCNASLSAEMAGVCYQTVFKHLQKDPAFFAAAKDALQLGYFRVEARQLQETQRLVVKKRTRAGAGGCEGAAEEPSAACGAGPPLPAARQDYEVRILGEEVTEEHFNPELALHLLREYRRHLTGSAPAKKKNGSTPRVASNKEIAEALAKRLKGFALRVAREEPERLRSPGEHGAAQD